MILSAVLQEATSNSCSPRLFSDVRTTITAQQLPPYATFETVITFATELGPTRRTFASRAFPQSGKVLTQSISAEERADPPNPYGTNVNIFGVRPETRRRRREADHLGVPVLDPFYSFGLRRAATVESKPEPETSGLVFIGRTRAADDVYDITCNEEDDGLRFELIPRRDPEINRLRELLVDRETLLPKSAVIDGNFESPLLRGTRWRVTFGRCGNATCIENESTETPFKAPDRIRVTGLVVAFEHVVAAPEPRATFEVDPSQQAGSFLKEPNSTHEETH